MMKLSESDQHHLDHGYLGGRRDAYAIIKASGATVLDYLQGQITQDIKRLTASQGIYTAVLTPQGKVVADLYIIQGHHGELIIITRSAYAEALVARLRQFSLGHELRIGIVDSLQLFSVQGARCDTFLDNFNLPTPPDHHLSTATVSENDKFVIRMGEAHDHGLWIITDDAEAVGELVDEQAISTARILKGLPSFGVDWDEKVFPLNANLIEFDGVSFDKGCYVGQEVTSRMQWRGGIKKRLYRVKLESLPDSLPASVSTTAEIGVITSAAVNADGAVFAIAHLPIESVESQTPLIDANGDGVQVIEACHV